MTTVVSCGVIESGAGVTPSWIMLAATIALERLPVAFWKNWLIVLALVPVAPYGRKRRAT